MAPISAQPFSRGEPRLNACQECQLGNFQSPQSGRITGPMTDVNFQDPPRAQKCHCFCGNSANLWTVYKSRAGSISPALRPITCKYISIFKRDACGNRAGTDGAPSTCGFFLCMWESSGLILERHRSI